MRVHIVPAVGQEPRTAAHALRSEAGLPGHAARRRIAHGVLEIETVKARLLESPGCHRVNRPRTHALPRAAGTVQYATSAVPSENFRCFKAARPSRIPLPASATAQCAPVSAAQPPCQPAIHSRASARESARCTCQRWIASS